MEFVDVEEASGALGLLAFVLIFALNGVGWISWRTKVLKALSRASTISSDIRRLRRDAETFNNPDSFVKFAKLQRQANAKEKELEGVWVSVREHSGSLYGKALTAVKILAGFVFVLALWGSVVVNVETGGSWWIDRFIRLPHWKSWRSAGSVAIIPWLIMCDRASQAIWQTTFPMRSPNRPVNLKDK